MLTSPTRRTPRAPKAATAVSALLLGLLGTACDQTPEHPSDENLVLGFRVTDESVHVKVPICPGEEPERVEVWEPGSETRKERLLWWGEGPTGRDAANGLIQLWSSTGYRKAAASGEPADLPASIDVSVTYAHQDDSIGDLVNLKEAARHSSSPGSYWTIRGETVSAQMIDDQLTCQAKKR